MAMNERFASLVSDLAESFDRLMSMRPVRVASLPKGMPEAGIYLFSESGKHLYVGRTRRMRQRLQQHCRPSSGHNSAVFAFLLARDATGMVEASYGPAGSRAALEKRPVFAKSFTEAKARVRGMDVRFVEERDPRRQALLEIYAAVALDTPHNDFRTH